MLTKELVYVDGVVLTGRHYSRIFYPSVTPAEYSIMQINENLSSCNSIQKSLKNIFASLLDNVEVNQNTIDDIEELLNEKRKGL